MMYLCNFYARNKEAVSNQIDILRRTTDGTLFAASLFMDQPVLDTIDLLNNRYIVTESDFNKLLPFIISNNSTGIHYFSEEPEYHLVDYFNRANAPIYISMYRKPDNIYAEFLSKIVNLKKVFIEIENHKDILITAGISNEKIIYSPTPSKFLSQKSNRIYNPDYISLVFGSWNGGAMVDLQTRGLIAILDLLELNNNVKIHILLRDEDIEIFNSLCADRHVLDRVFLERPQDEVDLFNIYNNCDYVAFLMQEKVTKDVPNSILDGFAFGKSVLMTNVVGLSQVVIDAEAGIVCKPGEIISLNEITIDQYTKM